MSEHNRDASSSERERVPAACREFLQRCLEGATTNGSAHECAVCAARVAQHRHLVDGLRQRPATPPDLHRPAFREAIFERIVDHAEGPDGLAAQLGNRQPIPQPTSAWPDPLLECRHPELVQASPSSPSKLDWARIRRDLANDVATVRRARRLRRIWLGAAGLAATAALALWLPDSGTRIETTIVFLDLDTPPSADYPWLGGRR